VPVQPGQSTVIIPVASKSSRLAHMKSTILADNAREYSMCSSAKLWTWTDTVIFACLGISFVLVRAHVVLLQDSRAIVANALAVGLQRTD
jgi:hypothetical protein